jgi:DNA-binding transcriptional MerR regulator
MCSAPALPPIPPKRYFTIGEVSELCGVKPHVLRYWEQEFTQLRPMKRRGNRRYYQHHEVLMIRRIRELLYEQGFTIQGARHRLAEWSPQERAPRKDQDRDGEPSTPPTPAVEVLPTSVVDAIEPPPAWDASHRRALLAELRAIRALLDPTAPAHRKAPENAV